ncbi:type II toxin-antitoxin system VapC family toxin [Pelomicrobium sp. G1]|uniref:type II toxin-antitoxin system VapC family toxin n=1 Tax=unclassified Pelomicrobium TaxID=2815318 RepID=UPI003F757A68
MILVDTSVWIDWLRRKATAAARALDQLLDQEDLALAPVVLQELLQGARGPRELEVLRSHFASLPMLQASADTYAAAGALYARCRWEGFTPRSPHACLIACLAIEHRAALLHDDRDFEPLARVEPKLRLVAV